MKTWIFVVILALLATNTYALGLATPPEKNIHAFIGENLSLSISVINQEGVPGEYKILFEGDLANRATAHPSVITIIPEFGTNKDTVRPSKVTINSTGLLPGTYSLKIIAELSRNRDSSLSIVQQVTRGITITFEYPPSPLNKVMNFVILKIKQLFNWIWTKLYGFYVNNVWLNYLFVSILLVIFFYIGTKSGSILRFILKKHKRVNNELKKIRKKGLYRWIQNISRDSFKKLKSRNKEIAVEDGQDDKKEDSD